MPKNIVRFRASPGSGGQIRLQSSGRKNVMKKWKKIIARKWEETLKTQQGFGPSHRPVLHQNRSMAGAKPLSLGTWGETQASGQGAPSAQVWWNLGLSSVQHNQTNAANKRKKKNNQNYIFWMCRRTNWFFAGGTRQRQPKKMSGECWNVEHEEMLWMRWLTGGVTSGRARVHQHLQQQGWRN